MKRTAFLLFFKIQIPTLITPSKLQTFPICLFMQQRFNCFFNKILLSCPKDYQIVLNYSPNEMTKNNAELFFPG